MDADAVRKSSVYKKLKKENKLSLEHCNALKENPELNPLTDKNIEPGRGVYNALALLCQEKYNIELNDETKERKKRVVIMMPQDEEQYWTEKNGSTRNDVFNRDGINITRFKNFATEVANALQSLRQ